MFRKGAQPEQNARGSAPPVADLAVPGTYSPRVSTCIPAAGVPNKGEDNGTLDLRRREQAAREIA
jgi:hypothetical protein